MNAMNINQATEIVTKAALQNANGASNAVEIIQATAFVRAYVRDQDEYVARKQTESAGAVSSARLLGHGIPAMVFDVESIGLHGDGYAVGYVVIQEDRKSVV